MTNRTFYSNKLTADLMCIKYLKNRLTFMKSILFIFENSQVFGQLVNDYYIPVFKLYISNQRKNLYKIIRMEFIPPF